MSSSRQHGAEHPAEEPDPTGVRALLSSLPDPGPMPEHVVLRIQQSLQREQEYRGPLGGDAAARAAATDFMSRREQREQVRRGVPRWAPWVGAAAAVAAGAMVVSTQFLGGPPVADLTASVGGTAQREAAEDGADAGAAIEEDAAELTPMADQDESAGGGGEDLVGSAAEDGGVIDLGDRTADDVEQLLREWYAGDPGPSPWGSEVAAGCAAAGRLAEPEDIAPSAYPARWQQQEAVVLLLPQAQQAEEAWVVEAGCLEEELAEVLHGPVPLDHG